MIIFACLICEISFTEDDAKSNFRNQSCATSNRLSYTSNSSQLLPRQVQIPTNTVVLTSCGHYFHIKCLEEALVEEKLILQSQNKLQRKSCPYKKCKKDLTGSKLSKINPVSIPSNATPSTEQIKDSGGEKSAANSTIVTLLKLALQNEMKIIALLKKETETLKQRLSQQGAKTCFLPGDKVNYLMVGEKHEFDGVINKVLVQVNRKCSANNTPSLTPGSQPPSQKKYFSFSKSIISSQNSSTSTYSPDISVVVPIENVRFATSNLEVPTRKTPSRTPSPEDNEQSGPSSPRPNWQAGDRVYLPEEKQSASIKWIGLRNHSFCVVIECDDPVGDSDFDPNDLPSVVKSGHGRKYTLQEFNNRAEKEVMSPPPSIWWRWGSRKGRILPLTPSSSGVNLQPAPGRKFSYDAIRNKSGTELSK